MRFKNISKIYMDPKGELEIWVIQKQKCCGKLWWWVDVLTEGKYIASTAYIARKPPAKTGRVFIGNL